MVCTPCEVVEQAQLRLHIIKEVVIKEGQDWPSARVHHAVSYQPHPYKCKMVNQCYLPLQLRIVFCVGVVGCNVIFPLRLLVTHVGQSAISVAAQ